MNLLNLPIFQAMTGKMEWLNRRQGILSQNLANSDTPGYTPNDLQNIDFSQLVKSNQSASAIHRAQLAAAEHKGQDNSASELGKTAEEVSAPGRETSPTGNSVVLEEQLIKVSETQIQYSMLTNLYRKQADMIRMAIGRN
ncbi:MAG TPA: flagellar basal body protein [Alphaproteobacteria bacterium]|nr:flagellar basal body protein [Alphaproteobacteria bacterium]